MEETTSYSGLVMVILAILVGVGALGLASSGDRLAIPIGFLLGGLLLFLAAYLPARKAERLHREVGQRT